MLILSRERRRIPPSTLKAQTELWSKITYKAYGHGGVSYHSHGFAAACFPGWTLLCCSMSRLDGWRQLPSLQLPKKIQTPFSLESKEAWQVDVILPSESHVSLIGASGRSPSSLCCKWQYLAKHSGLVQAGNLPTYAGRGGWTNCGMGNLGFLAESLRRCAPLPEVNEAYMVSSLVATRCMV